MQILDDAVGDVDSKPGDAAVEPEPIDRIEGIFDFGIPPVEVRLLGQEIVEIVLAAPFVERPGRPTKGAEPVVRISSVGLWVGPDIPIPMPGGASRAGLDKPGMAIAGVVGNDVEHDFDTALVRLANQAVDVGERAERRLDIAVVGNVVAEVGVRRDRDRAQPDGIDAKPLEIIEPADDTREVADAIAVRVLERTRIDLVDDAVAPP